MNHAKWTDRVWAAFHAKQITRAGRDVLLTLRTYCRAGEGWPSHATLADRAGVKVRTVSRWLAVARDLGLVVWREVRWKVGTAWRRATNRYRLAVPCGPAPELVAARPHIGLCDREGERKEIKHRSVAEQLRLLGVMPVGKGSAAFQEAMRE